MNIPRSQVLHIPLAHPSYAGHFPGAPLLPGSVLLSLILEKLPAPCRELDRVKLMSPTRLGECLTLDLARGQAPIGSRFGVTAPTNR